MPEYGTSLPRGRLWSHLALLVTINDTFSFGKPLFFSLRNRFCLNNTLGKINGWPHQKLFSFWSSAGRKRILIKKRRPETQSPLGFSNRRFLFTLRVLPHPFSLNKPVLPRLFPPQQDKRRAADEDKALSPGSQRGHDISPLVAGCSSPRASERSVPLGRLAVLFPFSGGDDLAEPPAPCRAHLRASRGHGTSPPALPR